MEHMNDRIRRSVRVALAERDMNQTDLARTTGMKPQYVSDLLTGRVGRIPTAWQRMLDALDLELIAVKRGDEK